jgi:FlaA1/EpsC-like NDP-sugar epimerase
LFNKINIVPRWVIFILDLAICLFSLGIAYYLTYGINFVELFYVSFSRNLLILTIINCFVFFRLKTYAGIVRYTSAQDAFRIVFAVIISNVTFLFINLLVISFYNEPLISNRVLIVNGLASFLILILYRILIKYFFMRIKNMHLDQKKVIVYGAGEAGLATKRTFDHDLNFNKKIVSFVDDDVYKIGKAIEGVMILNACELESLILTHTIDEIIFASYSIPVERKAALVDFCLANNVKVLQIPSEDAWSGGVFKAAQIKNINIEDLLNRKQIEIDLFSIKKELKGKRVLVTGGAGSIGSEIVRQLMAFETGLIIICDQSETALHDIHLELGDTCKNSNFHTFIGDVRDEKRMKHLFETYKPQFVFHAAAYKHVPLMEDNPAEAIKTNVLGTKTIADFAVQYGVMKFVMISTDKAVNPTNVMGASKRIAEIYVQSLNNSLTTKDFVFSNGLSYINDLQVKPITKFITTRFGNVLGSNGSVIPRFKEQIEKGGPVTVTHPEITRYFMTIPEACSLVLEAGCMGKGGEVFIFDMGKSVKIIELAKKMIRLAGLIPNQDIKIEFSGLRPGEKLYEELLNDHENTLPTHHQKIMIGKVREYVFSDIETQIHTLIASAKQNEDQAVVVAMKKLVKEYVSNNSIYEALDHEVKE